MKIKERLRKYSRMKEIKETEQLKVKYDSELNSFAIKVIIKTVGI